METKKKKKLLNALMVVLIVVIAVCGIMITGLLRGWFGQKDSASFQTQQVLGVVNIQRMGIGYSLTQGLALTEGDQIETKNGSQAAFAASDDGVLVLNEKTIMLLETEQKEELQLQLTQGELFAEVPAQGRTVSVQFGNNYAVAESAVFSVSIQAGSASLNVYNGMAEVNAADGSTSTVQAGESLVISEDVYEKLHCSVEELQAVSLNEFCIAQLQNCQLNVNLYFSASELKQVLEDRAAEKQAALEASLNADSHAADTASDSGEESQREPSTEAVEAAGEKYIEEGGTAADGILQESNTGQNWSENLEGGRIEGETGSTVDSTDQGSNAVSGTTDTAKVCTITILCDTILNNMDQLSSGKEAYVPPNGCILETSSVEFSEGETVFDVLNRVCSYAGIQLEYSWTPIYNSYYIEGISNLYEFDCGNESGWMYKVNGWFPNYGCSSYTLKDGDTIVWAYTCNGLGADVGA